MTGRLHSSEASFDALADHQHTAGCREPNCTATAWAEHHFLRIDRGFATTVTGKEGAMDCQRRVVGPARHQRDHCPPDAAGRMLQPGMEAERCRQFKLETASGEIRLDRCAARRDCSLPDCKCGLGTLGIVAIRLCPLGNAARRKALVPAGAVLGPQTTRPQSCDDLLLIATRMAADQDLAVVSRRGLKGLAFGHHAPGSAPSSHRPPCARRGPWRWSQRS